MNGLFPPHFALLEAKVAESRFDAIAISETKIKPLASDSHLALDCFNFFHVYREGMGGAQWAKTYENWTKISLA